MNSTTTAKYIYRICTDLHTDEDNTAVPVYGIEVWEEGADTPRISMRDLLTRQSQAAELVGLCNKLELDPIHLPAVVEDALFPSR